MLPNSVSSFFPLFYITLFLLVCSSTLPNSTANSSIVIINYNDSVDDGNDGNGNNNDPYHAWGFQSQYLQSKMQKFIFNLPIKEAHLKLTIENLFLNCKHQAYIEIINAYLI